MASKYKSLAIFLLLTVGGGLSIGVFTIPGAWYAALVKPSFNPPNWIFGPVWTVLYFMIAYAGWLLWDQSRESQSMKLWFLALGLNFLWSPSFFGAENIGLALIIILSLLMTIIVYLAVTWRLNNRAALLFLPYFAWVSFASLLNAAIFQLN